MADDERISDILNRAQALLGEHCTGFVLIAEFECEDGESVTPFTWGGGYNRALGLAARAYRRMQDADSEDGHENDGDAWKERA